MIFVCLTSLSMIISRLIHVAADGIISFFFMASCTVYMYHIFIHSSVSGHLGCSYVLTIIQSAAMNNKSRFFREEILPQDCSVDCWLNFSLLASSADFRLVSLHN